MEQNMIAADKFNQMVADCMNSGRIDQNLYTEYDVKRGLRDSTGKGVLTGLTEISDVVGHRNVEGRKIPDYGRLYYQGYDVKDLIQGADQRRYQFEEITYLLLFGSLPNEHQMEEFKEVLSDSRNLPDTFVRDVVMKATNSNMMNVLMKCVLTLYSYDEQPDAIDIPNVLRQSLQLIATLPLISVYGYHAYRHYHQGMSLIIRNPRKDLSTAENILMLLHEDGKYTELEARVLDVCLILHAEHGGGNNSTFSTHVISSSGTDTYSTVAASLGSLKGPKHGGANLKVQEMFENIKANLEDWTDEAAIKAYLMRMLRGEVFDHAGLIYGMGHAVYTLSDPRADILKKYAKALSVEKGVQEEFALYERVERIAAECIMSYKHVFKPICCNVDFYSGFVYSMLGLPKELFTPIFAIARISGWCAHRIEELVNQGKIIRPAYKYVGHHRDYVALEDRE
ncbi:MAG: citrate/2-methylcitrate synthase [Lachnospiraceae bacterium]|nr:citrate/2-methylcitrate synthase [Lachnospiraceae bacterium]